MKIEGRAYIEDNNNNIDQFKITVPESPKNDRAWTLRRTNQLEESQTTNGAKPRQGPLESFTL